MKLELHRGDATETRTISTLVIDGTWECFALEDPVRDLGPNGEYKVPHDTAIPAGVYEVDITFSQRFKKLMPILLNVPHFTGIRIHAGNTAEDTWGCILVGKAVVNDELKRGTSKAAYDQLFKKLNDALVRGEHISITITDDFKGATP
jgi:hypothetical protein